MKQESENYKFLLMKAMTKKEIKKKAYQWRQERGREMVIRVGLGIWKEKFREVLKAFARHLFLFCCALLQLCVRSPLISISKA